MAIIKSIRCRKVLNSHVKFTNEFVIELGDGSVGVGASPQGETISIYEDKKVTIEPSMILEILTKDGLINSTQDQVSFDDYLQGKIPVFGRNNAYGLSLAFFNATSKMSSVFELFEKPVARLQAPRICLNILNGGWHAYTNPVLSDFSEFMLVSKGNNLEEVIAEHNDIQRLVKEKQNAQAKVVVSDNPVNCFATRDNREVIEFLLQIVDSLKLSKKYDLMIDASAGDLWNGKEYKLGVTDNSIWSSDAFIDYWMQMIRQYNLAFLEDPFHEQDYSSWNQLTTSQTLSCIIGDNLYSSSARRIEEGALNKYAHAAVIKPNQAGTITAIRKAIESAQKTGQIAITSHRSISTESTFLALLTCIYGIEFIKVGPLGSDYSSVIRLNEIIRLTRELS